MCDNKSSVARTLKIMVVCLVTVPPFEHIFWIYFYIEVSKRRAISKFYNSLQETVLQYLESTYKAAINH